MPPIEPTDGIDLGPALRAGTAAAQFAPERAALLEAAPWKLWCGEQTHPLGVMRARVIVSLLLLIACGARDEASAPVAVPEPASMPVRTEPRDDFPPTAKRPLVEELRRDLAAVRTPADGGGRAWFEPGPRAQVVAEGIHRLVMVYEAGPLGIAPGGSILLENKKWWYWTPAQSEAPEKPGYVTAATRAEGVELVLRDEPATGFSIEVGGVAIEVHGRGLRPGERVQIVYGAGESLAQVDAFAERGDRMWLQVDGDGDGVRGLVRDSALIDVVAAPPTQLWIAGPSTGRVGERVRYHVAALDGRANWSRTPIELEVDADAGLEVPRVVSLRDGAGEIEARVAAPGIWRMRVQGLGGRAAQSNPLLILPDTPRVLWGDLHGHSNLSDGSGNAEDYFRFARDVAGLDVAALTDHDHVGRDVLDVSQAKWDEIRTQVDAFYAPGRFVTLLGFEWTSWIYGHRHVLYFDRSGEVFSSADPARESPLQLWNALRGERALTFAHHAAGGPIAVDWSIPPDPELETVLEIVSVHGSSEAQDTPRKIYAPVDGAFARDVLGRGYRLGFIGSGDGHDGHPGLTHLSNSGSGGIAGIFAEEATRDSVYAALRARHVYATNGPRIYLHVTLNGAEMGSVVPAGDARLSVFVVGEGPIERIDVIRGSDVVHRVPGEGRGRIGFAEPLAGLHGGETVYVRAVQRDGGTAWSSPFFVE